MCSGPDAPPPPGDGPAAEGAPGAGAARVPAGKSRPAERPTVAGARHLRQRRPPHQEGTSCLIALLFLSSYLYIHFFISLLFLNNYLNMHFLFILIFDFTLIFK